MFRMRIIERMTARLRAALGSMMSHEGRYEPARHYMRGPGPKSREAARQADQSAPRRTNIGAQV